MKVAVIVLNYNSSSDCKKCISYLLKQEEVELDIVVVDNCSSKEDRSKLEQILKDYMNLGNHKITYIPSDVNKGYNAGNNIGLRFASSQGYEYALIANPDMEFPDTTYIKSMILEMERNSEIVVQGSDIVNSNGQHQNPQRETNYLEELFWPLQFLKNKKNKIWNTLDYTRTTFCQKISGCCLLLKLSFLEKNNFFDENVFLYSEESILGAQVRISGKKMLYNSKIRAIHNHIEKKKGNVKTRMQILFSSRWYYLKTYGGYSKFALFLLLVSKTIEKIRFYRI